MNKDLLVDGKVYISASRASERVGYAPDYIGQLCRRGKISGKLIGRTWYVDFESLLNHKTNRKGAEQRALKETLQKPENVLVYSPESAPPLPELKRAKGPSIWHVRKKILEEAVIVSVALLVIAASGINALANFAPAAAEKTLSNLATVAVTEQKIIARTAYVANVAFFDNFGQGVENLKQFVARKIFFAASIRKVATPVKPTLTVVPADTTRGVELASRTFTPFDVEALKRELRAEFKNFITTNTGDSPVVIYNSPAINLEPIRQAILSLDTQPTVTRQSSSDVDLLSRSVGRILDGSNFVNASISGTGNFTSLAFTNGVGTSATTTNLYSSIAVLDTLTSTSGTFTNLLANSSTTLQNFTGVNATTTNATSSTFAITGNGAGLTFYGTGNHDISAQSGTLRIGSNTIMGNIEALDSTVDIGTAAIRFDKIYANEVNASTIVGTLTGGNLTAETFSINSDNATFDAENANLAFHRGLASPNALLTWDSTNDEFDFNSGLNITGTIATSTGLKISGFTSALIIPNGRVGIGTTSPFAKFAITAGASDTAHTLFTVASTTGGTSTSTHFTVLNTGNVGIGTEAPESKLQINVSSAVTSLFGDSDQIALRIKNTNSTANNYATLGFYTGNTVAGAIAVQVTDHGATQDGDLVFGQTTTGSFSEVMRLKAGNLGIGTSSPSYKLSVSGSAFFDGGAIYASSLVATSSLIFANATGTAATTTSLYVSGLASTTELRANTAYFGGYVGIGSSTPGAMLGVRNIGSGLTALFEDEASDSSPFVINAVGQVGIGTLNPGTFNNTDFAAKFQVSGVSTVFTNNGGLSLMLNDSSQSSGSKLFQIANGATAGLFQIRPLTDTGDAQAIGLTLNHSGQVGIGTTSPFATLSVAGNAYIGGWLMATGTLSVLGDTTLANLTFANATGTEATTTNLYVSSKLRMGGQLLIADGTAAAPGIAFGTNSDTGFYSDGFPEDGIFVRHDGQTVFNYRNGGNYMPVNLFPSTDNSVRLGSESLKWSAVYSTRFLPPSGSAAAPSYAFDDGGGNVINSGMYGTASVLGFSVAGTEKFRADTTGFSSFGSTTLQNFTFVNATGTAATTTSLYVSGIASTTQLRANTAYFGGKVGIGTTAPNYDVLINGIAGLTLQQFTSGATTGTGVVDGTFIGLDGPDSNLGFSIWNFENGRVRIGTADQERLTVASGGNVGIATSSPSYKLSVSGSAFFDGGTIYTSILTATSSITTPLLIATNLSLTGSTTLQNLTFTNATGTSATTSNLAISSLTSTRVPFASTGGALIDSSLLTFDRANGRLTTTYASTTQIQSTNDAYFATSGGNVGIGTAVPTRKFHIKASDDNIAAFEDTNDGLLIYGGTTGQIDLIGYQESAAAYNAINIRTAGADTNGLFINTSGNIGFGTTSPIANLDIFKTNADAFASFTASSTAGAHLAWTIGTDLSDSGKFKISSSTALGTNDRFVIDGSGKVGIGTTTPGSSSAPRLSVVATSDSSTVLRLTSDSDSPSFMQMVRGSTGQKLFEFSYGQSSFTAGVLYINKGATTNIQLDAGGSSYINGGNVGIGTTSPYAKLSVTGLVTDTAPALFAVSSTTGGTSTSTHFVINNAGNVGIGTENPSGSLEVASNVAANIFFTRASDNAAPAQTVFRKARGTVTSPSAIAVDDELGRLLFSGYNDAYREGAKISAFAETGFAATGADSPGRLVFWTTPDGSGTPTEKMRITSEGLVGIGSTTPGAMLGVRNIGNELSFMVEDQASDSSPFVVRADGNTGVGVLNPTAKLSVSSNAGAISSRFNSYDFAISANQQVALGFSSHNAGATASTVFVGARSHGSVISPTALSADDSIFGFLAEGYNDAYRETAAIYFEADTGWGATGVDSPGRIVFSTTPDGSATRVDRMTIKNSGNVGIGTTTPQWLLQLASTTLPQFAISDTGSATAQHWTMRNSGGFLFFNTASPTTFATATAPTLTLNPSGRVGIGTSSPENIFHVVGQSRLEQTTASDSVGNVLQIARTRSDTTAPGAGFGGMITFRNEGFTDGSGFTVAQIQGIWETAQTDDTTSRDGALSFQTAADGGNQFEHMRITSAGNIGIGTSTPNTYAQGGKLLTVQNNTAAGDSQVNIIAGTTGTSLLEFGNGTVRRANIAGIDGSHLVFGTNNSDSGTSLTERMRITATGNVGIGTTSPGLVPGMTKYLTLSAPGSGEAVGFELAGNRTSADQVVARQHFVNNNSEIGRIEAIRGAAVNTGSMLFYTSNAGTVAEHMRITSGGNVGIGTNNPQQMLTVTGSVAFQGIGTGSGSGTICYTAPTGLLSTSTTGCTGSSQRYKENITDMNYGLNEVLSLRPVTFDYKAEMYIPGHQVGFIAEEVNLVIPEVVGFDKDGLVSNIDYSKLTSVLVRALQELSGKVEYNASTTALSLTNITTAIGLDLGSTTAGLSIDREVKLNAGLRVDRIASISDLIYLESDVEFIGRPYFNADMGGLAVIEAGHRQVDIVFDRAYIEAPVVSGTITLGASSTDALLASNIKYVIANRSQNGFSILLAEPASEPVTFSWSALAIRNMRIASSNSTAQPAALSQPTTNDSQQTTGGTVTTTGPINNEPASTSTPATEPQEEPALEEPAPVESVPTETATEPEPVAETPSEETNG